MPETNEFDCPLCDKANNADDMVECDGCSKWFHYGCVQFDDAKKDDSWQCFVCASGAKSNGGAKVLTDANTYGNGENAAGVCNPISERTRLNLQLVEKQKECLLKGIELEHSAQLEKRKLLLEKEAWKAQYEILNASPEGVNTSSGEVESNERIGDWTRFLNPVSESTNRNVPVASSTTTVSATSSETILQFPTAGSSTISSIPSSLTAPIAPGPSVSNHPPMPFGTSATPVYHDHPVPATIPTSSFVFPSGGIVGLDSSTPVTTATWINPITGYTNPTQCLPATISSSGQFGGYTIQRGNVSQPYQVTSSVGNVVSLGQAVHPQCINNSVGLVSQTGNPLNTYVPYAPVTFPTSVPQHLSSATQVHPFSSSVPVVNDNVPQVHPLNWSLPGVYPNVPQVYPLNMSLPIANPIVPQVNPTNPSVPIVSPDAQHGCLPIQQLPVVNYEVNTPTPRQLAVRHAMPKDLPTFSGTPEEWLMFLVPSIRLQRPAGIAMWRILVVFNVA